MRAQLNQPQPSHWDTFKTISYYCLPVILLQWLGVFTSTLSTRFLSQYHTDALAASGLTYRAFLIVLLCLNGLQFAQGVMIAKAENRKQTIAQLTPLILLIGIVLGFTLLAMPMVLTWFHDSSHLVVLTVPYFHWLALTCPLIAFNGLWQQCFLVYKKPMWIVAVACIYFVAAVLSNHAFILGFHSINAHGLAGSSMAELTAQAIVMLFTLACITRLPQLSLSNIWIYRDNILKAWRKALSLGWPIALRWMNEMLALAIVAIFIGYLGSNALSGFRVVSQLDLLVLMIPYSMNIILALLLAQSTQRTLFNKTFSMSLSITIALILVCSVTFWLCPEWLLIHFFDLSSHKPQLLKLSAEMLMITGVGQLFNACRQICNAALRALDDTLWPFIFSVISYWGIAVLGSWLCLHDNNHAMIMIWWCVNGTYIFACLLSIIRLSYHLSSK